DDAARRAMKASYPPIRTGIVGYGRMAEGHVRGMRETQRYALVGVVDPTPARRAAARDQGMEAYETLGELLDQDLELVLIATHSAAHHAPALDAIHAGKHVLVEKPMTLTGDEAQTLVAASRAQGTLLAVYHQRRWDPDYRTVKHAVRGGAIGTPF